MLVHDSLGSGPGQPYGVYDIAQNEAWVSVGTDHDTAAFAVESIRRWWRGIRRLPERHSAADNGRRGRQQWVSARLWKLGCRNWRMRRALKSTCATSHQGPASGTRSNTACSPRSVRTGGKAAGRGGGELDRGDHDPDGAAGSEPLPGRAHRIGHELEAIYFVETLSMVNGIIRCYPALPLN